MSNSNRKITKFRSSNDGFNEQEKVTLFMAISQIIVNQDRIMKAMNIGNTKENEEFCNDDNSMVANACFSVLEANGISVEDDSSDYDDDGEE